MLDWRQIGEDFRQKYEGTFCRYLSSNKVGKEVFQLQAVEINDNEPPSLVLFNRRHGDIFLRYDSEKTLDFTYPQSGYFQHKNKALLFGRLYERQWKKGICTTTAHVTLPYPGAPKSFILNETTLTSAFQKNPQRSIREAIKELDGGDVFSVAISPIFAVGLSDKKQIYWLWYEDNPVAVIEDNVIRLKDPQFEQEIKDHLRNMGENARITL